MTLREQMAEMMRNVEAGTGIPKSFSFRSRQAGSNAAFEEMEAAWRAQQANKNRDAYNAAAFGYDPAQKVRREHKRRPQGKMEMLPFSCSQVGETVHLMGPGVHVRACSWAVASWATARLNRQHCEGQRLFEITEIQATLIVGQRRLA